MLASRLPALALALALVVAAPGCSKKPAGDDRANAPAPATASTAAPAAAVAPKITLNVTGLDANATAGPDEATVAAVRLALDTWLATAVVAPLHSGQPAGDLSPIFTPAALERLGDPAVRRTLVDEGLPAASTSITSEQADVALFSVAGPDAAVGVIAAQLALRLRAVGPTLDVDISHVGELVLVPEPDGSWRIDAFALDTARDSR